jgi:RNA polymerase sigma-70 factor (ECF subfamily)
MERALATLEREFRDGTRTGPFEVVRSFFQLGATPSYADAAGSCGMSVPRFKAHLHRARERFRELVRTEIAETTATPADVDAELAELVQTLA